MSVVAVLPYGTPTPGGLGAVSLDALDWQTPRPDRLARGTVGDMRAEDHLIVYPRTPYWFRPMPRARVTLMIVEPRSIHAKHLRLARLLGWRFHRILTRDPATLRAVRNARFLPYADTWIEDAGVDTTKTCMTSLIASAKRDQEGHLLRHAVVDALPPGADVDIMGRGYRPFDRKEEGLAPYRYSVVIENTREAGYLSEKIIDALICRTIPIYWGAPDVGDYFDPAGIIVCASQADILAAIDAASVADYDARAAAAETNRDIALKLADLHGRAARIIQEEDT